MRKFILTFCSCFCVALLVTVLLTPRPRIHHQNSAAFGTALDAAVDRLERGGKAVVGATAVMMNATAPPAAAQFETIQCTPPPISVSIDVEPKDNTNTIRFKTQGKSRTEVALLGSSSFNVADVLWDTVRFVSAPALSSGHVQDVNGDGSLDVVYSFTIREMALFPGMTTACLSGTIVNAFGAQDFEGCDSVSVTF